MLILKTKPNIAIDISTDNSSGPIFRVLEFEYIYTIHLHIMYLHFRRGKAIYERERHRATLPGDIPSGIHTGSGDMDFPSDDGRSNQTKSRERGRGSVSELGLLFTSTLYGRSRDAMNKTGPTKSVPRRIRTWTTLGPRSGTTGDWHERLKRTRSS